MDPPWTGVFCKLEKIIDLYFGDLKVTDFVKNIDVKYICLKVPKNYNLSYVYDLFNNIHIYKAIQCYIILIIK